MIVRPPLRWFGFALLAIMIAPVAPAAAQRPLERYDLGRDAIGDPCSAAIRWTSGRDGIRVIDEQPYTLTCRGPSAARVQGIVTPLTTPAEVIGRSCGASKPVAMRGVEGATARLCTDDSLGFDVVEIRFARGGKIYAGAAAKGTLGPLEVAMRAIAGIEVPPAAVTSATTSVAASIDLSGIDPAPVVTAGPASGTSDVESALQQGVSLIHRGLHADASRVLNDALSRLTADTSITTRIELSLAAALADSNIGQSQAADAHFASASATLASSPNAPRAAFLARKQSTYRALDLVNRRRWRDAIAMLDTVPKSPSPLTDPVELARLNQYDPQAAGLRTVSVTDSDALGWLAIEATRDWVRSVALLGQGQVDASSAALDAAATNVSELQRKVAPSSIVWLRSGVQRQAGRIAARKGDIGASIAAYDCAINTLQGFAQAPSSQCLTSNTVRNIAAYAPASGPVVAETQLERAAVLSRAPGADQAAVLKEYREAVDTLALSPSTGDVPAGMTSYLDLLLAADSGTAASPVKEEYFRALQAIGEPAIARDVARLQDETGGAGSIGAKVRDRADFAQRITGLRFRINALPAGDPQITALEGERAGLEAQIAALDTEVGAAGGGALYSRQVTVEAIRKALNPGEAYLKVAAVRARLFGIVITGDKTFIYPVKVSSTLLRRQIVDPLLASARTYSDPGTNQLKIDPFKVELAYGLFRAISGPASDDLAAARAIVVDPSGPLRSVPLGILVTSLDSVKAYTAQPPAARGDYSKVAFLGRKADLSLALMPSSFLTVRALAPATSPRPFIGLGQNAPAPDVSAELGARSVVRGAGCGIAYRIWATTLNATKPISANEIGLAATALGVTSPTTITGTAFNDIALQADSDSGQLAQYQVVHFATHGLAEQRYDGGGCAVVIPSALVTTMAAPDPAISAVSDGLLSFSEVSRLRFNANLVVLSACDTAAGVSQEAGRLAGQESSAGTLDGLVRAFISANARAVLATYWSVPATAETDELIETFYRTGRSASIGTALRAAQARLIDQPAFSHPYYWGAYFLVGDGSKSMLSGGAGSAAVAGPAASGH